MEPPAWEHGCTGGREGRQRGENRAVAWWYGNKSSSQPILSSSPEGTDLDISQSLLL
jgi:hypothetical protein